MELRFEDGRLLEHPDFKADASTPQLIMTTLVSLWQMAEWTTSRWLSLARTCRRFLASRVTGLHYIVAFVRARPHFSKFCISDGVLRLFVITALTAAPTDAMLDLLMKDDRLPLVLTDLDTEVQIALLQTHTLPPEVWSVFAGAPWLCLYKACDLVQSGRLWRPRVSPSGACIELDCRFSPSCGDHKAEKLEAFRTAPRPHDVVSQQIYDLLELGFPVESVIAGLQLLEQVSWSSLTVEQEHGCCTRLLRNHPQFCCQYDAMPQLLDAGLASGVGGQEDEEGQH